MKYPTAITALLVLASAGALQAQESKASGARPAMMGMTAIYDVAKSNVLKSAEQMPEDKYGFQATKEVRTFGQLIGHIADANYFICGIVGETEKKQYEGSAEKLATKAELIAAAKASFDACDATLARVTDADLSRSVVLFGNPANVAAAVTVLAAHSWEHYGNIVTYLRLNGMTPPSSQQN